MISVSLLKNAALSLDDLCEIEYLQSYLLDKDFLSNPVVIFFSFKLILLLF